MTTFNEKASAKNPIALRPPPHELRKFQDLRILDIAAGLYHILLFAVSKTSPSNSFDITSSDPNENIPVRTWSDTSAKSGIDQKHRSVETKQQQPISDFKNIISLKPVLARETLQAIQPTEKRAAAATKVQIPNNSKADKLHNSQSESYQVTKSPHEIPSHSKAETSQAPDEGLKNHSTSNEHNATMDIVTKNVSSIGDSLMADIKSIATTGEGMLNDLAKETEKTIKEVPKNVIDYVKSSISPEHGTENNYDDDDNDNVMKMDKVKESAAKEMPKDMTNLTIESNDHPPMMIPSDPKHNNNKLNRAFAEDDSNETAVDDMVNNEVKFINNGVDVGSSSDIIQAMNDEIHEMSNDAKNKADELTMKYDGIVNDELVAVKTAASNKIFEMKNGKLFGINWTKYNASNDKITFELTYFNSWK